jgi:hypothetical protein
VRDSSRLPRPLTAAQRGALEHVRAAAARERDRHRARIAAALGAAGLANDDRAIDALIAGVQRRARITVNFHPDRLVKDGRSVADALHDEGIYRSQFETKISNGSLTAYLGGDRDRWEERMFGGEYQRWHVTSTERPKYGGLDVLGHANGACPRFGSCHLRLRPIALDRATFTMGDSVSEPADAGVVASPTSGGARSNAQRCGGTIDAFEPVLAGLLEQMARDGRVLGRDRVDAASLASALASDPAPRQVSAELDGYIEAQLHGELRVGSDVEAIAIDASFGGLAAGERLAALADRFGLAVDWIPGPALELADVPDDFRGPTMPAFARRVADRHARPRLDAATIGMAAASVVGEPDDWRDFDSPREALQNLKYLWHILVVYGRPVAG